MVGRLSSVHTRGMCDGIPSHHQSEATNALQHPLTLLAATESVLTPPRSPGPLITHPPDSRLQRPEEKHSTSLEEKAQITFSGSLAAERGTIKCSLFLLGGLWKGLKWPHLPCRTSDPRTRREATAWWGCYHHCPQSLPLLFPLTPRSAPH